MPVCGAGHDRQRAKVARLDEGRETPTAPRLGKKTAVFVGNLVTRIEDSSPAAWHPEPSRRRHGSFVL